jgi:Pyruvate/2-oxoglutarate dehydrogenase complex, dihydrolipoamide dehydrogenase (E3) component, and related enzymes
MELSLMERSRWTLGKCWTDSGVVLTMESTKTGKEKTSTYDVVLVETGSGPYADGLGLKELGTYKANMHFRVIKTVEGV